MEQIAKEYGACLVYMLPVAVFAGLFLQLIASDGILCQAVMSYLNGLTG